MNGKLTMRISKSGVKRDLDPPNKWKAVCPRCKVPMKDLEPCATGGEFYHPQNGCVNGGKTMALEGSRNQSYAYTKPYEVTPTYPGGEHRAAQFKRKRDRRAKSLGARLARKMRHG